MSKDDDFVDPLDTLLAEEVEVNPPVGPNGMFNPLPIQPAPIPEATPENMMCLRGPCRYYVEITSRFQAGNTADSLGDLEPKQINRFCKNIPGTDIDLTDEVVSACSEWDPLDSLFVHERNLRRKTWTEKNKENE